MLDRIKVKEAARKPGTWTAVVVAGSKLEVWTEAAAVADSKLGVWIEVVPEAVAIASATEVPVLVLLQGAVELLADPREDRLVLAVRAALRVWDLAAAAGAGGNHP